MGRSVFQSDVDTLPVHSCHFQRQALGDFLQRRPTPYGLKPRVILPHRISLGVDLRGNKLYEKSALYQAIYSA
ncbi:hypothetical protein SAMN05518671_1544 [Stenotrophomonas lactitubi]|nr:hypothetical protein SAMN05518671_1544 [Stenotrophomonas lactitubi]